MQTTEDIQQLQLLAKDIRKDILEMVYTAGSGHIGGSFSATEAMITLFFNIMNHNPENPQDPNRDRFVLSKGHCTPAYYSVLSKAGYIPHDELITFRKLNSRLQGHPDKSKCSLMETSSGSLGQGLSVAAGIAFALRLDNNPAKIYCMLGDGELDEGQAWESFATTAKYHLNNLIVLIDKNNVQLDGHTKDIKDMDPLADKIKAFGHQVIECNGHDFKELINTLNEAKLRSNNGGNVVVILNTVKGKGVSFMENTAEWHGKAPNREQYEAAMKELEK